MNFENVLELVRVYSKADRTLRGEKLRKYTESKILTYIFYGGALALGILIGVFAGIFTLEKGISSTVIGYLPVAPFVLFLGLLFFSLWRRVRRMREEINTGISTWLPISWGEHTLASTLVNLLGIPLAGLLIVVSATFTLSIILGRFSLGGISLVSIAIAALMASMIAEVFTTLVDRLMKKISGTAGRAGIWLRFLGMLGLGLAFYIIWFSFTQGGMAFIRSVSEIQWKVWFIPSVWPGVALAHLAENNFPAGFLFLSSGGIFVGGLFYLTTRLNAKFESVEPAAITINRGDYSYGGGFFRKLGFSPSEASLISKDFRAFTRRKRLMGFLLAPLIFLVWPLLQGSGGSSALMVPLFAPSMMAAMLGGVALGSEGQAVWHLYSLPITAEGILKCKYYFVALFSVALALGGSAVSFFAFPSPLNIFIISLIESITLAFVLPLVALKGGISNAKFTEAPNPKMIGGAMALLIYVIVIAVAVVIISPLIYLFFNPTLSLSGIVVPIVGLLSIGMGVFISYVFYRLDLREIEKFLREVEV